MREVKRRGKFKHIFRQDNAKEPVAADVEKVGKPDRPKRPSKKELKAHKVFAVKSGGLVRRSVNATNSQLKAEVDEMSKKLI